MIRLNVLIIISLLSINIYSQQGWFSLNRIAVGNDINSVHFVNDSAGYSVTSEGYLLKTTDYGIGWNSYKLSDSSLNDVHFADGTGFVVGKNGKIYKTLDGTGWEEKTSGTNNNLNAVCVINADTVYAFGSSSTILKTTDGGETWIRSNISNPIHLNIKDAAFKTPDFGICAATEGYILRTVDYGSTWQFVPYDDYHAFYSVSIADDSTVFLTGWEEDIGFMLKSTDRGVSFEHMYPLTFNNILGSFFISPEVGFIVGWGGYISKTTNGGFSWETIYNASSKSLSSIYFTDPFNGYTVGEDSTILRTTNGGRIWQAAGSGFTSQLTAVHFPDDETGYAVGTDGEVYKIKDNKALLIYREPGYYNEFYFLHFVDRFIGFTGGSNGSLYTTTDGGESWVLTDFRPQGVINMNTIDFYDGQIGIISANDKLLKTTDGGENWYVINSNSASYDVVYLDESTLFSVGMQGAIFKSTDGGETWTQKTSPVSQSLNCVDFIDKYNGFAVGWSGNVLKTTDGGETWTVFYLGTTERLTKISFVSSDKGYICGFGGTIFFTSDGGNSWQRQHSGTHENLNDLFFIDDTTGYIAGSRGTLLKTISGGITGVGEDAVQPEHYLLYQNYPNPFNPITKIKYELPNASMVSLTVYDLLGRRIAVLVNQYMNSGTYETEFDGSILSSGVYFYQLKTKDYTETKKFVILR